MQNGMIIEIAVMGVDATPWPEGLKIRTPRSVDHYWRVRWIEDGAEFDSDCFIGDLASMVYIARNADEPVMWRYYETGVEP